VMDGLPHDLDIERCSWPWRFTSGKLILSQGGNCDGDRFKNRVSIHQNRMSDTLRVGETDVALDHCHGKSLPRVFAFCSPSYFLEQAE
jgi:hypothetical protein